MYVKRGSYTHALNDAFLQWRMTNDFADNGVLIGTTRFVSIVGRLIGTDASDLSTQATALEAAYASTSGNLVLLQNDGTTETHMKITGSQTIGGIRCRRLEYPNRSPGVMSTYLDYEIDVEAMSGGINVLGGGSLGQNAIISWQESLSFRGTGGPRFTYLELIEGPPQKQLVRQRTTIYASQIGTATGLFQFPTPPSPIWPQHETQPDRTVQRIGANSVGGTGNQQQRREFQTTWSYAFQAAGPLTASPGIQF